MSAVWQTTLSNIFFLMKSFIFFNEILLKFVPEFKLIMSHHWFRQWLIATNEPMMTQFIYTHASSDLSVINGAVLKSLL